MTNREPKFKFYSWRHKPVMDISAIYNIITLVKAKLKFCFRRIPKRNTLSKLLMVYITLIARACDVSSKFKKASTFFFKRSLIFLRFFAHTRLTWLFPHIKFLKSCRQTLKRQTFPFCMPHWVYSCNNLLFCLSCVAHLDAII